MTTDNPETGLEQQSLNKEQVLAELKKCAEIETQVALFAKYVDTYGIDPILSLLPVAGDISSSAIISTPFLLFQAKGAGLDWKSIAWILSYQGMDVVAGAVPVPVPFANSAADYVFKANVLSVNLFTAKVLEISIKAREAGASEAEIEAIKAAAEKIIEGKKVIASILGRGLKK
jgi:hypothetical protein